MPLTFDHILHRLQALSDPASLAGMARFGIVCGRAYGVRIPELRHIAKEAGRNHPLALRQIGKRNRNLHGRAVAVAWKIAAMESKSARWIAADALRELTDEAVLGRIR